MLNEVLALSAQAPSDRVVDGVEANDVDLLDFACPLPRRLTDYREERGMTIPQFTTCLEIAHFEYAHVVHQQTVDPRLRDQIAYRLGALAGNHGVPATGTAA